MSIVPIFICSKGRAQRQKSSWKLLHAAGVPCTIVVEPNEREAYVRATKQLRPLVSIITLPDNNQGIGYARHCVLRRFAHAGKINIMMDDDLTGFGKLSKKSDDSVVFQASPASDLLAAFVSEAERVQRATPSVVLFGLQHSVWCSRSKNFSTSRNTGGCNVVIAFDPARIPLAIDYRLDIHEDRDLALQVLSSGLEFCRFNHLSFDAPMMGKAGEGGLTPVYKNSNEVERQNNKFLSLWPSDVVQRAEGKLDNNGLAPIKVHWRSAERGMNPALNSVSTRQMCLRSRIVQIDISNPPPAKKRRLEG